MVRKERISIIHAHWLLPQGLIAAIYKKIFNNNIKIICTSHGSDILALGGRISKILKRFVLNNVDQVTVVSRILRDEIMKIHIKNNLPVHIISMGVDDLLFSPQKYSMELKQKYQISGPFLLFVGRPSPEKGVEYCIDVMPHILVGFPDVKLLIVGCGFLEKKLKHQALTMGLEKNVIFIGSLKQKELSEFYATADIVLVPSTYEGYGLVAVESLLSKTCVVVSDIPALSDIITHRLTGICTDVKNTKGFSRAVIELLENKEFRDSLANRGYDHAKRFLTWDILSKKYINILNSL